MTKFPEEVTDFELGPEEFDWRELLALVVDSWGRPASTARSGRHTDGEGTPTAAPQLCQINWKMLKWL